MIKIIKNNMQKIKIEIFFLFFKSCSVVQVQFDDAIPIPTQRFR